MMSCCFCKQTPPMVSCHGGLNISSRRRKDKVVIVMGATGTGKSRLAIDLATRFVAEVVNSDKMQVYKGLDIVTNKVREEECQGVPHHLLGVVDPNADFTAADFCRQALQAVDAITRKNRLAIIAGGSNSYIKALVKDHMEFRAKYECLFLWIDVEMPVLYEFVSDRVEKMVEEGLIEEAREFFDPAGDYTRGIKRAIGVPEMDQYFRIMSGGDENMRQEVLETGIENIKANTCKLASCQLQNILRLQSQLEGWNIVHRLDATEAFQKRGGSGAEAYEAWERLVAAPSTMIVHDFICHGPTTTFLAPPTSPNSVLTASSVLGTATATVRAGVGESMVDVDGKGGLGKRETIY
nr:adenylate isopentenyltransferase 5, chloroplastic-like [Ipomoea batatas]